MVSTLGMIVSLAHSTPNVSVSCRKLSTAYAVQFQDMHALCPAELGVPRPNTPVAASRMENTQSPSHVMHRLLSRSLKKSLPCRTRPWSAPRFGHACLSRHTSCFARSGIYSMMARRTRHCLSSANSTIAGSNDCDKRSIPITVPSVADGEPSQSDVEQFNEGGVPLLTASSFEMMFRRTSGNSSFKSVRNRGSRCSIVLTSATVRMRI